MRKGTVITNEKIAKDTFKIVFETDLKEAFAGQFVSILIPDKTLRRPFSISDFENGKITCLYKVVGEGTQYIKSLRKNDIIDYSGALGNGFNFSGKKTALLVGAGIGIAPVLYLKKYLDEKNIANFLIAGFKTEEEKVNGADKTVIGGSVLDIVPELIEKIKPDVIFSCGPLIVLKLISKIGENMGIETQVAMEKIMACHIGVCRGCVIPLKNGKNASVCKDGPVFDGRNILWG
ncbi:MAG: FAD-binding oxidoreductase [Candidatus Gastranaerophilales bacterium]|nr:FAD-binding oxidoreductase [Candidatus Gastranaerophilales bacterium]